MNKFTYNTRIYNRNDSSKIPGGGVFVEGVEYTKEALRVARERNAGVCYKQCDIYDLPEKAYDVVLCTEVLEHLETPEKAIFSLCHAAEKYVIITVPHEPWFCIGNLCVLKNVSRLGNPIDHINHWTKAGFEKFLKSQGVRLFMLTGSFPWSIAVIKKIDGGI